MAMPGWPGTTICPPTSRRSSRSAANPEHPGIRFPVPHMICAAAGCAGVVAWPAGAWRRGPSVPWGLRPAVSGGAVAALLALVAWFGVELITGGGLAGLAERGFGAALALWPLAVVASCRHAGRKIPAPNLDRPGMRPAGDLDRRSRRARNSHPALSHQGSSPPVQPNRTA